MRPRLLREGDVDALADTPLVLDAAREAAQIVAAGDLTTARVQVEDPVIWSRVLLGILPGADLLGYKEFHRVGKDVRYHVHLFRRSSGEHLGTVDGKRLTSLRTAGTAAVALAHYAPDSPVTLGIVGSGEEAREGLRVLTGAISVADVRVFSPTPGNREAFAAELSEELGIPISPVTSVEDAFEGAEVAYVATGTDAPMVCAEQVRHLGCAASIGSTRPSQRELDGNVFTHAAHVVLDCDDARSEPGDLIDAIAQGYDPDTAVLLGLDLAAEPATYDGLVLFKSIGSVEQDLVLAYRLLRAAETGDRGSEIEPVASLRMMR